MKMFVSWFKFYWNLLQRVQSKYSNIDSDYGLAPTDKPLSEPMMPLFTIIHLNGLVYWRIYASFGLTSYRRIWTVLIFQDEGIIWNANTYSCFLKKFFTSRVKTHVPKWRDHASMIFPSRDSGVGHSCIKLLPKLTTELLGRVFRIWLGNTAPCSRISTGAFLNHIVYLKSGHG